MQFPRLVFKSAENHKLVSDAEEMQAALQAGFFATVPEALEGVKAVPASVGTIPAEKPAVVDPGKPTKAAWGKAPKA